ncbi:hypothetical protein BKA82DRAFT_1007203 [Pisolithus tinctorius]|nr:hypothetical protein BKA82DRAFT_1007203 [Pisolithus tinctorius]
MRFVSMTVIVKVPQRWKFRDVNDVTTDNNSSKWQQPSHAGTQHSSTHVGALGICTIAWSNQ